MSKPILSTLTLRIKEHEVLNAIEKHKDSSEYINNSTDSIYDMVKQFYYYKEAFEEFYSKNKKLTQKLDQQRKTLDVFKDLLLDE